jgi:hypothetical protein
MFKKDILGGSLILIEKGDVTKKGVAKDDYIIITGGLQNNFINRQCMRAIWEGLKDEKIGEIMRRWEK